MDECGPKCVCVWSIHLPAWLRWKRVSKVGSLESDGEALVVSLWSHEHEVLGKMGTDELVLSPGDTSVSTMLHGSEGGNKKTVVVTGYSAGKRTHTTDVSDDTCEDK